MTQLNAFQFRAIIAFAALSLAIQDSAAQYANRAAGMRSAPAVSGVTRGGGVRTTAGSASMAAVRTGLTAFANDMGRMPTGSEGLMALIVRPPGATNWRGPYVSTTNAKAPFTDPWGMPYRYTQQAAGRTYIHTIASNGPDRVPGTRDDLQVQF